MTPGLDPSLFDEADSYRREAAKPKPRVDVAELQRRATAEAGALLKDAARVLSRAGIPTVPLLESGRWRTVKAADGWDMEHFILTKVGTAHQRGVAKEGYLGAELEVGPPRSITGVVSQQVFTATDDGRVEIWHNTYDYAWMLLEDWLNEKLREILRN